jgi:1-pyrroline-5-carboxylate dehydrogenase
MFNPPEELHASFDSALEKVKANLGQEYGMIIDGKEEFSKDKFADRSPIDTEMVLGTFQKGTAEHANQAIDAARKAFPGWSHTSWQERVALVRKAADLIDERIFTIAAAMSLEVGKTRMEALGDVAETSDLLRYACYQMEKNDGFIVEMGRDPLTGYTSRNRSVLRPYGAWLVISPFNFPTALTGGPTGAALVTGNTVVMKPATDTPWSVRLFAECLRDAGIPAGVFNFVTGPGSTLGQALTDNQGVAGATFTGSLDVGMALFRTFGKSTYVRPTVLELGGKNPAIISRHADLGRAVTGILRSAFGLQGQKCSACSRVYIEEPVYDEFVARFETAVKNFVVGDPTQRTTNMGPVINLSAYKDFQGYAEELSQSGKFLHGGKVLTEGDLGKGYFCAPTVVTDLPREHRLWKHEMFLPIVALNKISSLDEGMRLANDVDYGLTSGFYGSPEEVPWFFDHIEAGVNYANRPQGATTGAWPGFQPFGGWKGSGSTGKNAGGHYYLPLYMHEQIQNVVE